MASLAKAKQFCLKSLSIFKINIARYLELFCLQKNYKLSECDETER